MVQQVIDVGVNPDDGSGDSLYESGNKINNNFGDFFDLVPVKADIKFFGNTHQRWDCKVDSGCDFRPTTTFHDF